MAGIIKPPAALAASVAENRSPMCNKPGSSLLPALAAPAGMPPTATAGGTASSRQGSLNSGCFYDAESCYEACCNRESFLLPEDDLEETPYCTGTGAGCSQTPLLLSQSPLPGAGSTSAAVAAPTASVTPQLLGLGGAPAGPSALQAVPAAAVARSPLLSASTVAALMMEDDNSFDLLQLQLAPGPHQLMDEVASEQFMSLCGGPAGTSEARTAAAGDAAGMLFDAPLDSDATAATAAMVGDTGSATSSDIVVGFGGSSMEAEGRRGLLSSRTALTAVRGGAAQQADFGVSGSSGCDQQHPVYRLVLLDGMPGSGTAPGCVSPTSQRLGSSPSTILEQAARMGTVAAARAVCDDTFSGVSMAGAAGVGQPKRSGRPKGAGQRQLATLGGVGIKGRSAGSSSSLYGAGCGGDALQAEAMSDFEVAMMPAAADYVDPAELAATTPPAAAAAAAAAALAAAAAMMAADSGSGGDSSNEGAPGLQQDDSSSNKVPATVAAVKPKREFHHKGGGPCDHCGVLESPQWRRGPPAKPILCNACGTRYRRTHNLGPPIPSSGRPGGRHTASGNGTGATGTSSSTAGSSSSSSGSAANRKRPAVTAAVPVAAPPAAQGSTSGGVHLGTRSGSGAISGRRPVLKLSRY